MADRDVIETEYSEKLKDLYNVLFQSYVVAAGNQESEEKADEAFRKGVALARRSRDRALALLA